MVTRNFPPFIPPAELIGPTLPVGAPEVRAVCISTLTGAATLGTRSGGLGNATDVSLLHAVRAWADVVLVGAETVRREEYGPVVLTDEQHEQRISLGQNPHVPIAVLTQSLDLDTATPFFTAARTPPLILCPVDRASTTHSARIRRLTSAGAEIVTVGETGELQPRELIAALRSRGLQRVVCEGGPRLYSAMVAAGCVDVVHLSINPTITSPVPTPLFGGDKELSTRVHLECVRATSDSLLFLRYRTLR